MAHFFLTDQDELSNSVQWTANGGNILLRFGQRPDNNKHTESDRPTDGRTYSHMLKP